MSYKTSISYPVEKKKKTKPKFLESLDYFRQSLCSYCKEVQRQKIRKSPYFFYLPLLSFSVGNSPGNRGEEEKNEYVRKVKRGYWGGLKKHVVPSCLFVDGMVMGWKMEGTPMDFQQALERFLCVEETNCCMLLGPSWIEKENGRVQIYPNHLATKMLTYT